jgi:Leucine-rich repeat (LRR) protein
MKSPDHLDAMLKQIPRTIEEHHLTIPLVSLVLVTGVYFSLPLLSHRLTSLTTIGPCIAVLSVWLGLSASPGKGRVVVLVSTLTWLFVLWYAFPSHAELPRINFWGYQASFITFSGSAITTGVLLRIATRFRFTSSLDDQGWTTKARWGLFDLLLLTFGGALIVSAASAARIARFISDPLAVCGISSVIAAGMTILAFGIWVAFSQSGWIRVFYVSIASLTCYWVFSVAENLSLRSPIRPLTDWYMREGYFRECLFRVSLPESEVVTRLAVFVLVLVAPILCGVVLGNRLITFETAKPSSRFGRLLARIPIWIGTTFAIGACLFLSQARWVTSLDGVMLRRAGWPFYSHESSIIDSGGTMTVVPSMAHVTVDSSLLRGVDLLAALVPIGILMSLWLRRRRCKNKIDRPRIPALTISVSYLVAIYLLPALVTQQLSEHAIQRAVGQSVSWVTQSDSLQNSRSDVFYIDSAEGFKRSLAAPGGFRQPRVILNTDLSHDDLALLTSNHCLLELELRECSWYGDLSPISEFPHLQTLRLKNVTVTDVDVTAISQCRSLAHLELEEVDGALWTRWPDSLSELSVSLGDSRQQTWRLADLPQLSLVVMGSQPNRGFTSERFIHRDPVRLHLRRCGAASVHLDTALPVHLSCEQTPIIALNAFTGMQRQGTPTRMPRLVHLRSFYSDDASRLSVFEAFVEDCGNFEIAMPEAKRPGPVARIRLEAARRKATRFDYYFRDDSLSQIAAQGLSNGRANPIVKGLVDTVSVRELSLEGISFDLQLLSRMPKPRLVDALRFTQPIDQETAVRLVAKFPNLRSLGIPRTTIDDSHFDKILAACPLLEFLSVDGRDLQKPDVSNHLSLQGLAITGTRIPDLSDASLRRLQALSLGMSELPSRARLNQLLVCDTIVPVDLLRRWMALHPQTELNLFRAMDSMESMRDLSLVHCTAIRIDGTPIIKSVIKSWKVNRSILATVDLTGQSQEMVEDVSFRDWITQNLYSYARIAVQETDQ